MAIQESELSEAEFLAGFGGGQAAELSEDEFLAGFKKPKDKPGLGRSLIAGGLEGLANLGDMGTALMSAMTGAQYAGAFDAGLSPSEARRKAEETYGPEPTIDEQRATSPFTPVSGGLRGVGERVLPEEQRADMGILPRVGFEVGRMGPGIAASVAAPAAGATYWASQMGPQAYFETLQSTGDSGKATLALLGNSALAQIEQLGFGGQAAKLAGKLTGKAAQKAMSKLAMVLAVAKEPATEVVQQIGSDLIKAGLTVEDVKFLDNAIATATDPVIWILGGLGAGAEAAAGGKADKNGLPATLPAVSAGNPAAAGATAEARGEAPALEQPAQPAGKTVAQVSDEARAQGQPLGVSEQLPYQTPQDAPGAGIAPEAHVVTQEPEAPQAAPEAAQEPEATGIKNAAVEKELERMGAPLPEKAERRGFVELHAKAKETFESDPEAGSRLVSELEAAPRAPSDQEDALLTFEANRLRNEQMAAEEAVIRDPSDLNRKRLEVADEAYVRAANVMDRVGTESGRSLNARRMMLKHDYSLAEMKRKVMVAKGGKKLSEQEGAKVRELHQKIAATQRALDEHISQAKVREAELEARALLAEAKAFAKQEARDAGHKKRKASIAASKKKIDEITTKLARGQKAAAGLDPEKVTLTAQLATEYVKLGYQNFRMFADEVVAKVGEHIRPYLKPAWEAAEKASDEDLLRRYKARKEGDIQRKKEETKALPLERKRRKTPVEKDRRAIELKVEYETAKAEFETERERVRRANRSKGEKAVDAVREVFLSAPRALKFSFDLPPLFRQAARYAVPDIFFNPKRLATFFAKGVSAVSKKKARAIDVELRDPESKLYALAQAGKLDLPSVEEDQSSWLAQKLPGIGASARIYNTFMNLYRMSAFEGLLKGMVNPTLEDARTAARAVNILTGRGSPTGKVASLVDGLSPLMSSPRLLLSNFQTLAGAPLYRGTWRVRRKVAAQYARTLTGYAALYGLVGLVDELDGEDDVRVEWDPRSSDFGKIIVGEKRFDVLGGLSQVTTLLGRIATGETKSTKGKVTAIRGDDKPYKGDDVLDVARDFLRWKLSPSLSVAVELATGEQAERGPGGKPQKPTLESTAEGLLVPISFEDIYDDMRRQGVESTLALRMIGLLGVGARDYQEGNKK